LRGWLANAPTAALTLYAGLFAFSTYFCMYAFRKPFTAAEYAGLKLFGTNIDLKTAFIISQIFGYTLSKFIGIKICSEATPARRIVLLFGTILFAQFALLLFALLPPDLKIFAIFLNGLPLGMVWGLVVWFLEGRRTSEIMLTALSCSYILSSAVVKDAGRWLMSDYGIAEFWMPFVTGMLFLPGYLLGGWLLTQMPPPSQADVAARVERTPMYREQRWHFLQQLRGGLIPLLITFCFLTAYRDFRDNYGVELFKQLGESGKLGLFTQTELPVALLVMASVASLNVVRENRKGLLSAYALMGSGLALLGIATLLLDSKLIGGVPWMILIGLGSYLAYVPHGSVLFDRMVAATRVPATAVFTIYVADAIGYTGSVFVQLYKDLGLGTTARLDFFRFFSYAMSLGGVTLLIVSARFFARRTQFEQAVVRFPEEKPEEARKGASGL
jgi:hypothetical protein